MLGPHLAVLEWWYTSDADAPEAAPPNPPTGAAVVLVAGPTARVSWTAPVAGENVDTYAIFRSADGAAYSELSTDLSSPYNDAAVSMGSTYAYKVVARNDAGDSDPTAIVSLTIPTIILTGTVSAGPQVDLVWVDYIGDETNFSIERRDVTDAGAFAEIDTAAADATTYADAGPFTAKHRYAYRLAVVGGASDGEVSNTVALFGGTSITRRLRRWR